MGMLSAPLLQSHGRSCPLMPAQCYRTGGDGQVSAVSQDACTLAVYTREGGLLAGLTLEKGKNRQTIQL